MSAKPGRPARKEWTQDELVAKAREVVGGRVIGVKNKLTLLQNTGALMSNFDDATRHAVAQKIGKELIDCVKDVVNAITEGKKAPATFDIFG